MGNVTVIGAQWGDEGKGKIVDWLSSRAEVVVRFQGGHNAGHTLVIDGKTYKLSLLPSGVVRGKLSVIGNGVVVDPWALLKEMDSVRAQGVTITPDTLKIAENAALILPVHATSDQAREAARGNDKIGTTGRGIGPAYEDKVARRAVRIGDLHFPETLPRKVERLMEHHNALLRGYGAEEVNPQETIERLLALKDILLPYVTYVPEVLYANYSAGKPILFEGAQGMLLDVDHGTYPFVTSSNTVAAQAASGSGLGASAVGFVLGITKAYTTRVGSGPFPTEQSNDIGETLGQRGHEFGTVTGRKRRCGWFDAVLVRQSARVAGIHGLALTKLDVLDGLPELKICTGYRINRERYSYLPAIPELQALAQPDYMMVEGWSGTTRGARRWVDLPAQAIKYVRLIEELTETPVTVLSTSPEREDTILVQDPFQ